MRKLFSGVLSAAALFCVLTPGTAAAAPADCIIENYGHQGAQVRCNGITNAYRIWLRCNLVGPPSGSNPAQKHVAGPWRTGGNPSGAECGQFYRLDDAWPEIAV